MGDTEKDKRLLDRLDGILKGEDPGVSDSDDTDNRTALEFARKMTSLGKTPSEKFAGALKAELIQRLAEQEKETGTKDTELEYWGIPRRKRWQGTVAALITLAIVIVTLILVFVFSR